MLKRLFFFLVLLVGSISLIRSTMGQGTDFFVYWKAGRALLEGHSVYDLEKFGGMIFKYPPWLAPFFIPISLLPFEFAKFIWGVLGVFSIFTMMKILKNFAQVKLEILFALGLLYWGIWAIHALDGQVAIPLMALALFSLTRKSPALDAMNAIALSSKVFTVFPLLLEWKRYWKPRTLLIVVSTVLLSTAFVIVKTDSTPSRVIGEWREAASSGAKYLPEGNTRGKKNPSLSNYTASLFAVPVQDSKTEVVIALIFFALAALYLIGFTQNQDYFTRFCIALALTPVAHPLPWLHLFSWTFPLMAITANLAWQQRARRDVGFVFAASLLVLAILMVPLGAESALGAMGSWFEWHAGKGFGTVFLVGSQFILQQHLAKSV